MNRYLCIHGHFYQPPRENPWLEAIEQQDSAYPFHDWNERIAAECYRPNGAARILDDKRRIARIVNNYTRTSFNFGPTLLSWLESWEPDAYRAILEADAESRRRFSGHGAALAQGYSHLIMPLANDRDRRTQVRWGIADFEHRFGRPPEGMWLPETAVDTDTLEALAEAGLAFTILAPHQAGRIRPLGAKEWQAVPAAGVATHRPYLCPLPSGHSIALFFYQGRIASEIAFGGLLEDGERFAARLNGAFAEGDAAQLVHVATDGETYGHHHRFGEMALAYCLDKLESRHQVRLTVYGEFLEKFPPTHEVEIVENTSWSCAHGVERWRSDCGCHTGGRAGWTQAWRRPLREALDGLRDRLVPLYQQEMTALGCDPWAARDAYIEVVLDRRPETVRAFLRRQAGRALAPEEEIKALRLLELQRHALLMYTSCGWFFDEVSGIETTQILAYAGRAVHLAEEACGLQLEEEFLGRLKDAKSNLPKVGDAARVYRDQVASARIDLYRVAAHHAIASGFAEPCPIDDPHCHDIHCYATEHLQRQERVNGRLRLAVGRSRIRSRITWNQGEFRFAVLDLGGHNITAGVGACDAPPSTEDRELVDAFERSDIPAVVRLIDARFAPHIYSLWYLFRDEQRRILQQIMTQTLEEIEGTFHTIYEDHSPLLRFLHEIRMPVPRQLALPVEQVFVSQVRRLLEDDHSRPEQLAALAEQVTKFGIPLDDPILDLVAGRHLERKMDHLARSPQNLALLLTLVETLEILGRLPINPDLWRVQNRYWGIHQALPEETPDEWSAAFRQLGKHLQMAVD